MMTAAQLRMARAALKWTTRELGEKAQVNPNTITRFENGSDTLVGTMTKLRTTLEDAGVVFIPGNGHEPGVALKKRTAQPAS
jgi:transcriptional regulator with XRE-family HTH domain